IHGDLPATGSEVKIEFLNLRGHYAAIAASKEGKQLQRFRVELQGACFGTMPRENCRILFPAAFAGVELLEERELRHFLESFVERPPQIDIERAEKKMGRGWKVICEHARQALESSHHRARTAS